MKKIIIGIFAGLVILFSTGSAQAIIISFDPVSQAVDVGTPVDVNLTISGLGDFAVTSLSTFDLSVSFDPTILGFNSASYGDPILGDQLDLFGFGSITATTLGTGTVNLFELSFDFPGDLDTLQPGAFTLATLSFDTLATGISALGLSVNALGDSFGDPLGASPGSGSVTVAAATAVPEPSIMLLLVTGLAGLAVWRRKARA